MTKLTMNKSICRLFFSKNALPSVTERDSVSKQIRRAKFVEAEGCYFLDYLYNANRNVTLSNFQDETGYECFVNHFHIDRDKSLLLALSVCSEVEDMWLRSEYRHLPLRQIVSSDSPASSVYSFHVVRPGESWLADDLSTYAETVVVVETIREEKREE